MSRSVDVFERKVAPQSLDDSRKSLPLCISPVTVTSLLGRMLKSAVTIVLPNRDVVSRYTSSARARLAERHRQSPALHPHQETHPDPSWSQFVYVRETIVLSKL